MASHMAKKSLARRKDVSTFTALLLRGIRASLCPLRDVPQPIPIPISIAHTHNAMRHHMIAKRSLEREPLLANLASMLLLLLLHLLLLFHASKKIKTGD